MSIVKSAVHVDVEHLLVGVSEYGASCNSICVRMGSCRVIEKATVEFADQVGASGAELLLLCEVHALSSCRMQ